MNPGRRAWLRQLAARAPWGVVGAWGTAGASGPAAAAATDTPDPVRRGRPLVFPRDHGAHPGARIEWWYATGWLQAGVSAPAAEPVGNQGLLGFQLTFFRSRTDLAQDNPSRFAARQLLFAHAALTLLDPAPGRHLHTQRMARWNGRPDAGARQNAALDDAQLQLGPWSLRRSGTPEQTQWAAELPATDFSLSLQLLRRQRLLLQGDSGFSSNGPEDSQASHYYREPQLQARGRVRLGSSDVNAQGRARLDHEWSDEILHPEAVGWDWVGFNLFDGSALTAFQLRRRDGSALWAGGGFRPPQAAAPQVFSPGQVQFSAERWWTSPATGARYPVQWRLLHPAGTHTVRALLDPQELDGRNGTGTVYWEGLSELLDTQGRRVGLGYLEMTGYSGRLQL